MFLTKRGSHIWPVYYCLLHIWHNACMYMFDFYKAYLKYQSSPSFSTSSFKVAYILRSLSSVQFSHSVMSDSLWHHGLQYSRLPCLSQAPRAYSNSCPLSWEACLNPISPWCFNVSFAEQKVFRNAYVILKYKHLYRIHFQRVTGTLGEGKHKNYYSISYEAEMDSQTWKIKVHYQRGNVREEG